MKHMNSFCQFSYHQPQCSHQPESSQNSTRDTQIHSFSCSQWWPNHDDHQSWNVSIAGCTSSQDSEKRTRTFRIVGNVHESKFENDTHKVCEMFTMRNLDGIVSNKWWSYITNTCGDDGVLLAQIRSSHIVAVKQIWSMTRFIKNHHEMGISVTFEPWSTRKSLIKGLQELKISNASYSG